MFPKSAELPMVTTDSLAKYVGGQVEIQCLPRFFLVRGEVRSVTVADGLLRVQFAFVCKADIPVDNVYRPWRGTDLTLELAGCGCYDAHEGRVAVLNEADQMLWAFYPPTHPRRVLADGRMYNAPF